MSVISKIKYFVVLGILMGLGCQTPQNDAEVNQSNSDIKSNVSKLIATMTLEDKIGEMTQLSLDMICKGEPYNLQKPIKIDTVKLRKALIEYKVGSILNNGGFAQTRQVWHNIISTIQNIVVNEKKSKIPVLYGIDAIHGTNYTIGATLFPQELNLAATFNPDLITKLAEISAYETKASSIPWSFSPVLDIGRDPRWSRFWETLGEDPYLGSQMSSAMIKGYQGKDVSHPNKVAACMKHFIGYSLPKTGKDRTPVWLAERQLREYFIPSFKAAIDAGAKTIMINSGEINGIPVHANAKILQDLLRDELGFKGLAVTDWEDIHYLYKRHHVAKDYKDAIRMAINAGIDMSMVPLDFDFCILLKELVEEGKVKMSRIDEAVTRILTLKFELGLFKNPVPDYHAYPDFGSEKFKQIALESALESIVLLKNDQNILPINPREKILIVGPTAHSLNALNGAWTGTWQGLDETYNTKGKNTIYEAIQNQFADKEVKYIQGTSINEEININKAVSAAKKASIAIICIGEMPYTEKPGDIHDLNLPEAQIKLVEAIAKTKTPIILVLVEGRPRIISKIEPLADAIIFAGLPSDEGGDAIAKIIFGQYNPNGKLPFTYPRYANDLMNYDYKGTEKIDTKFGENAFNPQWEFGHGLSYTTFEYKNLNIETLGKGKYNILIDIKNTGEVEGKEVIQLFISDKVASITPSIKRLRAFDKISLKARETKQISFSLTKDDLKFVGKDNLWIVEPGQFEAIIDTLRSPFELK